jgi:hypothetical protein
VIVEGYVYARLVMLWSERCSSGLADFGIAFGWKWSIAKIEIMKKGGTAEVKIQIFELSVPKHKPDFHLSYKVSDLILLS